MIVEMKKRESKILFDFKPYFVALGFAIPAILSFFVDP